MHLWIVWTYGHAMQAHVKGTWWFIVYGRFDYSSGPKNVCNSLLMGQVLVHQGATAIPTGNVQRRWTVCARNFSADDVTLGAGVNTEAIDAASRKNMLYLAAMDLMNYGSASTQGFNASMKAIAEAKFVLRLMTDANLEAQEPCTDISTQVGLGSDTFTYTDKCDRKILAPVKVRGPGRPATIRLKLRADYYGAKHRKTWGISECYTDVDPLIPEPIGNTIKGPSDTWVSKRDAKCGLCGVAGHNRKTCGRKVN